MIRRGNQLVLRSTLLHHHQSVEQHRRQLLHSLPDLSSPLRQVVCQQSGEKLLHDSVDIHSEYELHVKCKQIATILKSTRKVLVITGAGISTESGIPDYRSPLINKGQYKPLLYQEFSALSDQGHRNRQRYWLGSFFGWHSTMDRARPSHSHWLLSKWRWQHSIDCNHIHARMAYDQAHLSHRNNHNNDHHQRTDESDSTNIILKESIGWESFRIITQNVDSLHYKTQLHTIDEDLLELHGTLRTIECSNPSCSFILNRNDFQTWLMNENPWFADWMDMDESHSFTHERRPDGDSLIRIKDDPCMQARVIIPKCPLCGSDEHSSHFFLRPSILFFGENMVKSKERQSVGWAREMGRDDVILVLGSTLETHSSLRLITAHKNQASADQSSNENHPSVYLINIGSSRIDHHPLLTDKISFHLSTALDIIDSYL